MKLPKLNHDAFMQAVDRSLAGIEMADIQTRAEVRLTDAQETLSRLDGEYAEARAEITKTKAAITQLNTLLIRQEAIEGDIAIERNAVVATISALQASGVPSQPQQK